MKPEGALTSGKYHYDLSEIAFEDALINLKCFPMCILRVHSYDASVAQHIVRTELPAEGETATCPRVHIVIDETYAPSEWSIEYEGKVFWSPGACG